jgi:hypothetical protein
MTEPRYRRSPRALHRVVGEEVLLASPDREGIDILTGPAAAVWRSLEDVTSARELADSLGATLRVPSSEVLSGIEPLLDTLSQRGWVEVLS